MSCSSDKQQRKYSVQFANFNKDYADRLLTVYLKKCRERHWFAFVQFRAQLPGGIVH